jgi:hypothetical protein
VTFLRFAGTILVAHSSVEIGLFQIADLVEKNPGTNQDYKQVIRQQLDWFLKRLPVPERFNLTRSKGYYRRNSKGICWFNETASECLARMYILKGIAEEYGYFINVVREDRIGYIIYEDEFQAVAEPFSDTRTR